jgi:hypothetical protein
MSKKQKYKITYKQALADWHYLWDIDEANDMTGGYVDQRDLDELLHSPTKSTARDCLCQQIMYWFSVGTEAEGSARKHFDADPMVREIAERHKITMIND